MHNMNKIVRAVFEKNDKKWQKPHFDPLFAPKQPNQSFFWKSGSVTFFHLGSPNFMQKKSWQISGPSQFKKKKWKKVCIEKHRWLFLTSLRVGLTSHYFDLLIIRSIMALKNVKYVNPHYIMKIYKGKRKFPQISNTILGTFLAISRPGTTFI